jgi:hypothetical protein
MYTDAASGVVIHHSKGGAMPRNGCTMGAGAAPENAGELLHFAIEGPASQVNWLLAAMHTHAASVHAIHCFSLFTRKSSLLVQLMHVALPQSSFGPSTQLTDNLEGFASQSLLLLTVCRVGWA